MDERAPAGLISIELVWLAPQGLDRRSLRVPDGSTLLDALRVSGLPAQLGFTEGSESELEATAATRLSAQPWVLAVHGQRVGLSERLHDHDRIELLPPLLVDPKIARQRRAEHRRRQKGERRWSPDRAIETPTGSKPA